jgi:hypothetical protein
MAKLARIFYILFSLQVGIFLFVFPWLRSWEMHVLIIQHPTLHDVLMNNFVRGAVSGLGIVNLAIGSMEALDLGRRKAQR